MHKARFAFGAVTRKLHAAWATVVEDGLATAVGVEDHIGRTTSGDQRHTALTLLEGQARLTSWCGAVGDTLAVAQAAAAWAIVDNGRSTAATLDIAVTRTTICAHLRHTPLTAREHMARRAIDLQPRHTLTASHG